MRTEAGLTLSKKRLVLARFRPRLKHRNRLTMRVFCLKERERCEVGNQSISKCSTCRSKVKENDLGVYCSYGLNRIINLKEIKEQRNKRE